MRVSPKLAPIALVAVAGTIAAIVFTAPLVRHAGEAIPYGAGVAENRRVQDLVPGDHLQFYYYLALVPRWVSGEIAWFQDPLQFSAPEPRKRPTFFFLPFSLLFAAASPLGGAFAYNLLVWLSFPAAAVATFALGRRLGLEIGGAALAAAAATLFPYRVISTLSGHPAGFVFFLLPLVFACLERAWWERSAGSAAVAGAVLVALAWNEPHYLFFLGFLLPIWAVAALFRLGEWHRARDLGPALATLAMAALGPTIAYAGFAPRHVFGRTPVWSPVDLVLLWACMLASVAIAWRLTAEVRARAGDPAWTAQARAFLPLLALAAYGIQPWLDVPYGGRAVAALTIIAMLVMQRGVLAAIVVLVRGEAGREAALRAVSLWPFVVGGFVAGGFVLYYKQSVLDAASASGRTVREIRLFSAKSTDFLARSSTVLAHQLYPGIVVAVLALFGTARGLGRVMVPLAFVFAALALGLGSPIWSPFHRLAYELLPFFGWIRQSSRFVVLVELCLAIAAGTGLEVLRRRVREGWGSRVLVVGAIALVTADFATVFPIGLSRLPLENRAYAVVGAEARGTNLLEIPIWPGDSAYSSIYQYWTTRTAVPIVNGYSPTTPRDYVERTFQPLDGMNVGEMNEAQARRLDDLRVRFVTVHADAFPEQVSAFSWRRTLAAMRRNPNLVERSSDSGVHLFERRAGGYRPFDGRAAWPIGAFYEAERLRLGTGQTVADERASGATIVRGSPGHGFVVYGPYRPFPPGSYLARFRTRGGGSLDVTSDHGHVVLARGSLSGVEWAHRELAFVLEHAGALEFRAAADAGEVLDVDWVLVESTDPPGRPAERIEAEELTATAGLDREAADASAGAFAELGDPAGAVARDGPYRFVRAGRLALTVRSRGGPFLVRVEGADGLRRFGEIEIAAKSTWEITRAEIEVPEDSVIVTRFVSLGPATNVDWIDVVPPA